MQASDVIAYLKAHPNFLEDHPELVALLTPPAYRAGETVLDMQRFMVEKLRSQIDLLQGQFRQMLAYARDNQTALQQVHHACLQLLPCTSRNALLAVIHEQFPQWFRVDVVRLLTEADVLQQGNLDDPEGMMTVPVGTLKPLLGHGDVRLGLLEDVETELASRLCGGSSPMIASYALVDAGESAQGYARALLFATRDAECFEEGQGTDILRFLGKVVAELLTKHWET